MIIPILNKTATSENFVSSPFPETTCTMTFIVDPDAKEGNPEGKIGDIQIDYTPHYLNPNAFELSLVEGDGDEDNSKVQIVNGTEIHSVGVMEDVNFRLRCTYVPYDAFSEQAFEVDLDSGIVIYPVNSAYYNGSGRYAEKSSPVPSSIAPTTQEFSFGTWINANQITGQHMIVNTGYNAPYWDVYIEGSVLYFRISDTNTVSISASALLSSWNHVVFVKNHTGSQGGFTGEMEIYLNGAKQTVTVNNRTSNLDILDAGGTSKPFSLGRRSFTGDRFLNAYMSFSSLYIGTAISQAQIDNDYNNNQPICPLESSNSSILTEAWNGGNFNGNTGSEFVGLKGVMNLTPTLITYTDQGLTVECTT